MIPAIKFRELVVAEAADTKNKTGAYHKLGAFLIDHADALLALVEDGWQPIETAPRDGQDILVYCQDTSEMFVAFNDPDEISIDAYNPGIFYYALTRSGTRIGCRPHLWKHLPSPPETKP